jgi:hypothetical protein
MLCELRFAFPDLLSSVLFQRGAKVKSFSVIPNLCKSFSSLFLIPSQPFHLTAMRLSKMASL